MRSNDLWPSSQRISRKISAVPFQREMLGSLYTRRIIPDEYRDSGGTWVPGFTRRRSPVLYSIGGLYHVEVEDFTGRGNEKRARRPVMV